MQNQTRLLAILSVATLLHLLLGRASADELDPIIIYCKEIGVVSKAGPAYTCTMTNVPVQQGIASAALHF